MAITPETLKLSADARKKLLAITDAHYLSLVTAWVATWDDLGPELEASLNDVFLSAKDGKGRRTDIARNKRLAATLQLANQRLQELADSVGVTVGPDLPTVAVDGHTAQASMIGSQLPAAQVNIVMDKFTAAPIDAMVARTLTQIHKDTRPLAADVVRMMESEHVRGISLGNNPRKTGQRIVKAAEGRFNGGLTRAADDSQERVDPGPCLDGCDGKVRAIAGARWGRCTECRERFEAAMQKQWMISEAWHVTAPLPQVVRALHALQIYVTPKDAENWASHRKLIACIADDGTKTYQLKQVHAVHQAMEAKRAATKERAAARAALKKAAA